MPRWPLFGRKPAKAQQVTTGRFEMERDGQVAYLEYSLAGDVLGLIHTEVPQALRGKGIASSLAETALHWAREHNLKADIICPTVEEYVHKHPEFQDLVL